VLYSLFFEFWDKMDRGFILIIFQVSVNTIVACIELSAFKPLVTRGIACIEYLVPVFVPSEEFCELRITVWKIVETETIENRFVGEVGLTYKSW